MYTNQYDKIFWGHPKNVIKLKKNILCNFLRILMVSDKTILEFIKRYKQNPLLDNVFIIYLFIL